MYNWKLKKTNEDKFKEIEYKFKEIEYKFKEIEDKLNQTNERHKYSLDLFRILNYIPDGISKSDYIILSKEFNTIYHCPKDMPQNIGMSGYYSVSRLLEIGFILFKDLKYMQLFIRKEKFDLLEVIENP